MRANIVTALYMMLIGMGVVFTALVALQGFINLGPRAEPAGEGEPQTEEISPEEQVVIGAAVAEALNAPVRVYHIRLLPDESQETWSRIGRLDIMRSHGRGGRSQ